jgi:DNA-directed RNA polymerase specialized sigma24 family protein
LPPRPDREADVTDRHVPSTGLGDSENDPAAGDDPTELSAMPLDFTAFRELHHPRYLSYARVWFHEPAQAAAIVELAFRALAGVWREVLGSPNPAAAAWQILRTTVAEQIAHRDGPDDHATAREWNLPEQRRAALDEDLAILHYVVGLATPEIADVVGGDSASIASQLRHAFRHEAADW